MLRVFGVVMFGLLLSACDGVRQGDQDANAASGQPADAGADADVGAISSERLAGHLRMLASDEFEGRAPDTPGEEKTVAYISEQFAAAGLQPAGDGGGWTQAVTLERTEIAGPVAASFAVGGDEAWSLVNGEDIALETLHPDGDVALRDVPVVFAGYGITAPERDWDDYAGLDVRGKVGVVHVCIDPTANSEEMPKYDRFRTWYAEGTQ